MEDILLNIDKEGLFKKALEDGINLFTGAGFSSLPDKDGNYLPKADELAIEICEKFLINKVYSNDLEKVSTIAKVRAKDEFDSFLRNRFKVSTYNELYKNLNLINIESFITTNIDNIIQCVMDDSNRYFLSNMSQYGATRKSFDTISFIPLHGNVNNIDKNMYFGNFELASVSQDNSNLFQKMYSELRGKATFFWGYGFHDSSVSNIIAEVIENKKNDIWIQCMPGDNNIDFFRELGCYIVESSTEEILQWIGSEFQNNVAEEKNEVNLYKNKFLKNYMIPTINQIEVVSTEDFYQNGRTHWHNILAGLPYNTSSINEVYNKMQKSKNIIITGMPLSGKTVLLMQLAAKANENFKFFISDFTEEKVRLFVNNLNGAQVTVFVDEFCEDIVAYKALMKLKNVNFVGITDSGSFETTKHLIEEIDFERMEFGELSRVEAQMIFNSIPPSVRQHEFKYKKNEYERFSMFELMLGNVRGILTENRIEKVLNQLQQNSQEGFEIVALSVYFQRNKSIINMDVLLSYFGMTYQTIMNLISEVQDYLSNVDIVFEKDEYYQDYFNLRSDLFSYWASRILCDQLYKAEYSKVIRRFINNVQPHKIYKYYIFKRSAFDASLFKNLFNDEAHDLYNIIYGRDASAYTLQQMALYKAYLKDFKHAFIDIDKALTIKPKNFSIQNSRAIILFEANKEKKTELAVTGMRDAMDILQKCYKSDKRKNYHAIKYAKFALFLFNNHQIIDYIEQAFDWLNFIYSVSYNDYEISRLRRELEKVVAII